jgi:hypothetical protein
MKAEHPGDELEATADPAHMTARTGISMVEIAVNRWSTDAERDRLLNALVEKGPEKLLDVLQEMRPVGSIRTMNSLAYDLRFAHRMPSDEGASGSSLRRIAI